MNKCMLFIFCAAFFIFAEEIIVNFGETKTITNRNFENYSGDFVIKNNGVLILENCTFKNNVLGSKTKEAILSSEKIVAPIVNFGKLSLVNCKFINNYSWNTALSNNFEAKASAGAIANFGELELADNNIFENNWYQKGNFTIIRDNNIEQFEYIGDDKIYNLGEIEFVKAEQQQNNIDLQIEVALIENVVSNKAQFLVKTNKPTSIKITISDAIGVVFSIQQQVQNSQVIEWNLTNSAGTKVASGTYSARIEADNFVKVLSVGVKK